VTVVGPFLDFRDFSTPAGELDLIADLEVSHSSIRSVSASSIRTLSSSDIS
jgi:hypothetical protein